MTRLPASTRHARRAGPGVAGLAVLGVSLAFEVCALFLPAIAVARRPTLRTITVDGDMSDWDVVLANPVNVSEDGDASSFIADCSGTPDRDCPRVQIASKDIARFAWTQDDSGLYFYLERFAASAVTRTFWVAVDVNRDDNMESGERLIRYRITGPSNRTADRTVFAYAAANISGLDPMLSGGFADGYTMPGGAGAQIVAPTGPLNCGASSARQWEFFVSWDDAGQPSQKPVTMHVSLGDDPGSFSSVDDNCGGPDRMRLWTVWTELVLDAPQIVTSSPSTTIDIAHRVTLEGAGLEFVNFRVVSSVALTIELWQDFNLDGLPDPSGRLALDADGDGVYETLDVDGSGDLLPDDGIEHRSTDLGLIVRVVLPATPVDADLEVCAMGFYDPTASTCITDRVVSGELSLTPNHDRRLAPGRRIWFEHEVANRLGSTLSVDLSGLSSNGWAYTFHSDPDANGVPDALLTDSNANSIPDLQVRAGDSAFFVAQATVPAATPLGTIETFDVSARAFSGTPQASARDLLTVAAEVEIDPSHLRPITNGYVAPGRTVLYRHILRNNSDVDMNFSLTASSSLGWSTRLFSDPDGDGDPADGVDLGAAPRVSGIPKFGGQIGLVLQLQALPNAALDAVDVATLTAYQELSPFASGSATDETIVSQLATFRDAPRLVQSTYFVPCDTIYATAFQLRASLFNGYQFNWYDDSGALVRSTQFTSDAAGRGFDQLTVPDGASGSWLLSVTELPATIVDDISLTIEAGPTARSITTDRPSYALTGDDLTVDFTLLNAGVLSDLTNFDVDAIVLNPSRTQYLTLASNFQAWTGTEFTRTWNVASLAAGATWSQQFTIPAVTYPGSGNFIVLIRWRFACSGLDDSSEQVFQVVGGGGCSDVPLVEVGNVRVRKSGADVVLTWSDMSALEPCVTYRVWDSVRTPVFPDPAPPWWRLDDWLSFTEEANGLAATTWTHAGVVGERKFRAYIIQPASPAVPEGPRDAYYGPP